MFSDVITDMCLLGTGEFLIYYQVGGPGGVAAADGDEDGIPDYIEELSDNLSAACELYLDQGYGLALARRPAGARPSHRPRIRQPGRGTGLGHFIVVGVQRQGSTYTARHELFHIAQVLPHVALRPRQLRIRFRRLRR